MWLWIVAAIVVAAVVVARPSRWRSGKSVTVVVLGDIGHSPRMRYHVASLISHHVAVQLVGYVDSDPGFDAIALGRPPKAFQNLILKAIWQALSLFITLYRTPPSQYMLVQNPPSIPTLLIATIICRLRNTRLVIDWHNLGYTILGLKLGPEHYLVKASRVYENVMARMAWSHIAVSKAMCRRLRDYNITATAVYDRPASHFRPLSQTDKAKTILRLPQTSPRSHDLVSGHTRLVVSSTSWTPDEDFGVLLDALQAYSAAVEQSKLPNLLVVITGKGPLKAMYEQRIHDLKKAKKLVNVQILTAWLSIDDYAALLGAADLGVSLHCSSSGVDLPMKVVDMFGCGLPVVGYDSFEAWPELVTEGVNGRGFHDAGGLDDLLEELFGRPERLNVLREGALKESSRRWEDEWPAAAQIFGLS